MHQCACQHDKIGRKHGIDADTRLAASDARQIARVMDGLATQSRVMILGRLRQAPCSVGALCEAVGMAQPAVSQQLRILRELNLVVGVRNGRQTIYALYDPHVAVLLDEALRHIDHLRVRAPELPELQAVPDQPAKEGVR